MTELTDQQLEELETRATAVCEQLPKDHQPLVIEFAGLPKSGKSTVIDVLSHFFKRMNFSVHAPSEGASKRTPYHLRRDLVAYNTWTLNYGVSELLAAFHSVQRPDLIILDRGPFDSLAWLGLLCHRGELTKEEYEVMRSYALLPRHADLIQRVYLFTCSPADSLGRETHTKLTRRTGSAMNEETLTQLLARYEDLEKELGRYPVERHDTSGSTSSQATSYEIAGDILDLFEAAQS